MFKSARSLFAVFALVLATCSVSAAPPPCLPSEVLNVATGGTGSRLAYGVAQGRGDFWMFKCPDGTVHGKARLATVADNGPTLAEITARAMTYQNPTEAMNALWELFDTPAHILVGDPNWEPLRQEARAFAALLPVPGAPAFTVARNGTYADRPTYPVVDGLRGRTSNGRATVGAACTCTAGNEFLEGTVRYCLVRAGSVAICTAAAP